MAVSAKFIADFSTFSDAVQKAEIELKSFETGAGKVGTALQRMTDSLSGRKLIQDAQLAAEAVERIGGPSKLTANELERVASKAKEAVEKARALGLEATPEMQKLADSAKGPLAKAFEELGPKIAAAFSVTAIIAAGKKVLDFADQTSNLAARLGISTSAVQKFDLAFAPVGVSVDTVARASQVLAKNLVEGDKSAVGALTKLGLSAEQLKRLAPEDQFLKVADAVGKIQNPTEKTYAALTIFGKGGAELLAGLNGHLEDTTKQFEAMGLIVSEETIKAADDFGDQLGLMGKQLMAIVATVVGPLLPSLTQLATGLMKLGSVVGDVLGPVLKGALSTVQLFWAGLETLLSKVVALGSHLPLVGDKFKDMAEFLKRASAATVQDTDKLWRSVDQVGSSATRATPPVIGLGKGIKDEADATKEANKAAADHARLLDNVIKFFAAEPPVINAATQSLEGYRSTWNDLGTAVQDTAAIQSAHAERSQAEIRQVTATHKSAFGEMQTEAAKAFEQMHQAAVGAFTRTIISTRSFSEAFLEVWESIKRSLFNLFDQIIGKWVEGVIGRMTASITGSSSVISGAGGVGGVGGAAGAGGAGMSLLAAFGLIGGVIGLGALIGSHLPSAHISSSTSNDDAFVAHWMAKSLEERRGILAWWWNHNPMAASAWTENLIRLGVPIGDPETLPNSPQIEGFARGGSFWTKGPTPIMVGEGGESEFVSVTPKSKMRDGESFWNASKPNISLSIGAVYATSEDSLRRDVGDALIAAMRRKGIRFSNQVQPA